MAFGDVARMMISIGADVRGAMSGINQTEQRMGKFASSMKTMMTLGGVGAAITAVGVAVNKALDFGAAGANLINLERSFERFTTAAGASGDTLLAQMKAASGGMMGQAALMQQYNSAYLLMGDELAGKMPEIIKVANAASIAGMGDFQYLVNSLVKGLGRMSPLILDNLGLTVKLEDVYAEYASTLGKASTELTKTEQQQALLNAVMEQAQKQYGNLDEVIAESAGGGIARLRTAWTGFGNYLKTEFAPIVDDIAARTANAIDEMTPGTDRYREATLKQIESLKQAPGQIDTLFGPVDAPWLTQWLQDIGVEFASAFGHDKTAIVRELAANLDIAAMSAEEFAAANARIAAVSSEVAREQRIQRDQLAELQGQMLMTDEATRHLQAATDAEADSHDAAALAADRHAHALEVLAGGLAKAQSAAWKRWRQNEGFATQVPLGIDPLTGEPYYAYQAPWEARDTDKVLEDQRRALASTEKYSAGTGTALRSAGNAWDEYASRVRSAVDSILQPTQSVDLGSMFEQMGLREDAWDEKARRAMDVFNLGTDSPWAESLGLGSKEEAAQWVKDFYMGRMPEQIDWASFDLALAEANEKTANWERIKEMAYERAAALGLGGEGVAGALSSMGIGGYLGQGAAMAGDLTEGFQTAAAPQWMTAGSEDAGSYYGSFQDSFTESDWLGLGDAAGEAIKEGILEAASEAGGEFLDELASEISPYVAKYLAEHSEYQPEV